jgi:hypothetical protein
MTAKVNPDGYAGRLWKEETRAFTVVHPVRDSMTIATIRFRFMAPPTVIGPFGSPRPVRRNVGRTYLAEEKILQHVRREHCCSEDEAHSTKPVWERPMEDAYDNQRKHQSRDQCYSINRLWEITRRWEHCEKKEQQQGKDRSNNYKYNDNT